MGRFLVQRIGYPINFIGRLRGFLRQLAHFIRHHSPTPPINTNPLSMKHRSRINRVLIFILFNICISPRSKLTASSLLRRRKPQFAL